MKTTKTETTTKGATKTTTKGATKTTNKGATKTTNKVETSKVETKTETKPETTKTAKTETKKVFQIGTSVVIVRDSRAWNQYATKRVAKSKDEEEVQWARRMVDITKDWETRPLFLSKGTVTGVILTPHGTTYQVTCGTDPVYGDATPEQVYPDTEEGLELAREHARVEGIEIMNSRDKREYDRLVARLESGEATNTKAIRERLGVLLERHEDWGNDVPKKTSGTKTSKTQTKTVKRTKKAA